MLPTVVLIKIWNPHRQYFLQRQLIHTSTSCRQTPVVQFCGWNPTNARSSSHVAMNWLTECKRSLSHVCIDTACIIAISVHCVCQRTPAYRQATMCSIIKYIWHLHLWNYKCLTKRAICAKECSRCMPHTEAVNSMPYTAAVASKGSASIKHRPAERRVYCSYTRSVNVAAWPARHTRTH